MRKLEQLLANVERNLKNGPVAFRIYTFIFIFSGAVLIFGIFPLVSTIKNKLLLSQEMAGTYSILQQNITNLETAETNLKDYKKYTDDLAIYMPEGTDIQSYMLEFIQYVSARGYLVRNFSQRFRSTEAGRIELTIDLESPNYPSDLASQIEKLKRVTQVQNLVVIPAADHTYNINLVITIFTIVT